MSSTINFPLCDSGTGGVQVDALLGDRGGSMEHETSRNMRTEFMQLWDGLLRSRRVLVVAATNQPDRLPDAIWRRFSSHFEVRSFAAVCLMLAEHCSGDLDCVNHSAGCLYEPIMNHAV